MRISTGSAGVGVTFLSQYPDTDAYYRLRRYGSNSFHIASHGTAIMGGVGDSGVVPAANVWYAFRIQVEDTGTRTEIRARVWAEASPEPLAWQIDAYDDSPTRLSAGTVGVWSLRQGQKLWDDLHIEGPPVAPPLVPMTIEDFHISGTQMGDIGTGTIRTSKTCESCHSNTAAQKDPFTTWSGSLMALAGRDPLFFAQMTTANQDVANAGNYCMRCHVPMSFVTGHALPADGSDLDDTDKDGVTCHFCHSMVDPVYTPGLSPVQDYDILEAMPEVPQFYANSMFVLDPSGTRRGPRADADAAMHQWIYSPFHSSGDMCGTCHDVGNVAVSLQPDGSYRYNVIDESTPSEDPHQMFPLERTYTEWKLSAFANGGVDMGGRFGGDGASVVESCQDCHMPRTTGQSSPFGPERSDLATHEFAGAGAQVLDLIAEYTKDDPEVDQAAIASSRAAAVSMLERAATVELSASGFSLDVRTVNESGHKIPTGHIEGRRMWLNVVFRDVGGALLAEYGHYDAAEAELDEGSTTVYEMHVGLSEDAAQATGLPAGHTGHMALADTIVKDNRIPPRGFDNTTYEAGGAPVVGASYADGQHWDDTSFPIPVGASSVVVTLYYQNTPRHYIEALRDANHTDSWGDILHQLWLDTGRGAPIPMVSQTSTLICDAGGCVTE